MKKILGVLALVVVLAGGWMGYKYWDETYRATDAYAIAPETPKKEPAVDDEGKAVGTEDGKTVYAYDYTFEFVTKSGEKRTIEWEQSGTDITPFKKGEYVYGQISKKRVTNGPNAVAKSKVPASVLSQLTAE